METSLTLLPILIFKHYSSRSNFVSFVDNTLTQCCQLKLKKFKVHTSYDIRFRSQINNWIRHCISRNVEQLKLTLWNKEDEFSLDQCFFINTCFTRLRLTGFIFNPDGEISWKNLKSLCITNGKLEEDLIGNILSGSPVLKTLRLVGCDGFNRLDITLKSIKKLVLNTCYRRRPLDIVEIKAPNILSVTIKGFLCLRKLLFVNMSSLVEANLDYEKIGDMERTCEEEMLKVFIQNLRHVNELKIGVKCSEVVSRLEARGFVIPSNMKLPDSFC